jgi:aminocarboxymuconate-semialdehyde decarboxylase
MERMDTGWRDFAETKAHIDELPSTYLKRLYYDTVSFSPPALRYVHDLVGADHMLMGSDYPHLLGSIDRAVSTIAELDVPQADRDAIFSGNALRILNNVETGAAAR